MAVLADRSLNPPAGQFPQYRCYILHNGLYGTHNLFPTANKENNVVACVLMNLKLQLTDFYLMLKQQLVLYHWSIEMMHNDIWHILITSRLRQIWKNDYLITKITLFLLYFHYIQINQQRKAAVSSFSPQTIQQVWVALCVSMPWGYYQLSKHQKHTLTDSHECQWGRKLVLRSSFTATSSGLGWNKSRHPRGVESCRQYLCLYLTLLNDKRWFLSLL